MTVEVITKCNECNRQITEKDDVMEHHLEVELEKIRVKIQAFAYRSNVSGEKSYNLCSRCLYMMLHSFLQEEIDIVLYKMR